MRHWELDEQVAADAEDSRTRRRAGVSSRRFPSLRSGKKKNASAQEELVFDEGKGPFNEGAANTISLPSSTKCAAT